MRRPERSRPVQSPKVERQAAPNAWRDRLAVLLALGTIVCLGLAFFFAKDTQLLMPGPLASAHRAIENCATCHTASGSGKLSWLHSLIDGNPLADSHACLSCHKMPDTAFNAHGAAAEVLNQSTQRLLKIAAVTPAPQSVRVQNLVFPTEAVVARGLYCATCHQEHQGVNFDLNKISTEQCHSCHVVKFDSFDGHHPKFESYPFKRRTRIIYDHAGHGGKHFPEAVTKGQASRIPATCSTCHSSSADRRIMAVAPFDKTCSACHLEQITGKERVSGPKGIAFLTLPGLDLQTLKEKNASIGEWPAASEAELTPFMKMMISRNERGRALIRIVDSLNLQDLSDASDDQIKAVTDLAWEIKRLFYALIIGKASDVLGDLNIECGAKLSATLVADLTASIPRDVVVSAHQQWLPNLGAEMANRPDTSDQEQTCSITTIGGWVTTMTDTRFGADREAVGTAKPSTPDQTETRNAPEAVAKASPTDPDGRLGLRADEVEAPKPEAPKAEAPKTEAAQPKAAAGDADTADARAGKDALSAVERPQTKAADQTDDLLNPTEEELRGIKGEGAAVRGYLAYAGPDGGKETLSTDQRPRAIKTGIERAEKVAQAEGAVRKPASANTGPGSAVSADAAARAAGQTDDLLNPTEEELRGIGAPVKDAEKAAQPEGAAGKTDAANTAAPDAASKAAANAPAAPAPAAQAPADAPAASAEPPAVAAEPQARAAPVIAIESNVDPESWAEYGGWYRQDYAIFYRPTGHKDKFIYSWLVLTGHQAAKGDTSPAAAVFDFLTSKDAQGSCTKCHSVDDIPGTGRAVNFSPPSVGNKQGRFTNFIHEPHFGLLKDRGCLSCHNLEKGGAYLQSYEQGDPRNFASNFSEVKKDLCQTCHTSSVARQDCLLCHKYHVNGVITPIMSTKIQTE